MRFPESSTTFFHYVNKPGLGTKAFPNPLTPAATSTVVDLAGETSYAESVDNLPPLFREVSDAWAAALEEGFGFSDLQGAIRDRDTARLKRLWGQIVPRWDDRSFSEFVASSPAFSQLSFRHREVFGQVGFGTGGWEAHAAAAHLLVVPEAFLTGYAIGAAAAADLAEASGGKLGSAVAQIGRLHRIVLVCVPTANMVGVEQVSNLLIPARAYESQLYIAYANYCGADVLQQARKSLTYLADRRP